MKNEKTVVVLQSNYLPWKGYFDLIRQADLFIFYDDVKFTKNDWRNRNKIKTPRGTEWITIPCGTDFNRLINQVNITRHEWQEDHWKRIQLHYANAAYFPLYKEFFEEFYRGTNWNNLSELNQYLIRSITGKFLKFPATFENSTAYSPQGIRQDRLLDILKKAGATRYVSGPAAKSYISEESFNRAGIKLIWMDYGHYPPYRQQYPPFAHDVSIIDLLFNEGPHAMEFFGLSK